MSNPHAQRALAELIESSRAEGYARAVAILRDDERYRRWWTARDDAAPDSEAYWKSGPRNHLADYLEAVSAEAS